MNHKLLALLLTLMFPIILIAQDALPEGTELLTNNYFDEGLDNWELYSLDNSRAEYELDTNSVITGKNSVHITIHKPYGDYPSGKIQLNQHNIPGGIVAENSYYISFNLKSNIDIEQCFWTIYKEPDYNVFYDWEWVKYQKSDGVKSYSYTYRASGTDTSVYFAIDLASFKKDNVELWIDDIHFIALPEPKVEPPLPRGGIELLSNNYFNDGLNKWDINVNNSENAFYNLNSDDLLEGKHCAHIRVNHTFDCNCSQQIQFYQKNLLDSVKVGNKYHIQFLAKASKSVSNLFWSVNQQNAPSKILHSTEFSLPENEMVSIIDTISFTADELVSWSFDLATVSKDSVDIWFDAIHLMDLGEITETIFPPETIWEAIPPANLEKPKYLETIRDDKYGVDYTCISDPITFGVPGGSNALLTHYPKDQAWNADMSKIILGSNYLVNADNYKFEKVIHFSGSDTRWSNTDPNKRYFCSGDSFYYVNIETNKTTFLHKFPEYNVTVGPWEGNISADDKYVVITDESGGIPVRASLYDIELDSVISQKTLSGDIDWVSVPPSGDYIIVANRGVHKIEVYDRNFNFLRNIGVGSEHGDFGVDSEGHEVWVQVIPLSMSRLSDGKFTRLLEPNIGGHISGRGFRNPGWALVSTDINHGGITNYYYATQLFEVKLDGSGTIRHFGYARSSCIYNYPMGTVSPDGKKVLFNSDWKFGTGSGGNSVAYISEYKARPTDVQELSNNKYLEINFRLSQNYPNPFNPTTMINYSLPTDGMTKLSIYNILGQEVKVLINEHMRAGSYTTPFDGSSLSSGVYFYKLQSKNQVQVKKMLLLK